MSQASQGQPRCSLNLVRVSSLSLSLPFFGRLFLFPRPRGQNIYIPLRIPVLYQTPGSSAAVLQSPVMSNTRQSSATQSVHCLSFPPAHVFPRSPAIPTCPSWVSCCRPCGAAPPTTITSLCVLFLRYEFSHSLEGVLRRGYGCSATCTRFLGFEATPVMCCAELPVVALKGRPCSASV